MARVSRYNLLFDSTTQSKISVFYLARLVLMAMILISTTFLKREVLGVTALSQIYAVLSASFFISLVNVSFWEQTLKVRYFMPSQLLYDLLLTSYLVYLTGINDSIFLFLYLLNIVFASLVYQLHGALLVSVLSGLTFLFIYYANNDMDEVSSWYNLAWHELLFLLTALLSGQFMDELKKQKLLLESQRESIERLELMSDRLLNSIPAGIVLVDANEYVQKINFTAISLLKLSHAPEMRMKYYELLPELKGIVGAWPKMTEVQRLRYLFRQGDRHRPHLSLQLVRLEGDGDSGAQHIIVFQDVSKMLELEERLEFESKLAATGELAAGIAHEIRNPLASISGSIELLAKNLKVENDQDQRLLDISLREIRRLDHLITDFLEFAKPTDITSEDFALAPVVSEVAEALLAQGGDRTLKVVNGLPSDLRVHANRERMKQVFFNLFLNSLEAARSSEVLIRVEGADGAGTGLTAIAVKDNGPGVEKAIAGRIFDPFFTTKNDGTGLGLATVAQILRAAKGNIQLLPGGEGAHFVLYLPVASSVELAGQVS